MDTSPIAFWHAHLGRHLSDLPPERSPMPMLPTRTNKSLALKDVRGAAATLDALLVAPAHSAEEARAARVRLSVAVVSYANLFESAGRAPQKEARKRLLDAAATAQAAPVSDEARSAEKALLAAMVDLEPLASKTSEQVRLGSGFSAYYIVTPTHAWLIGKVIGNDTASVTFVPADGEDGQKWTSFIGQWLRSSPEPPFMIGTIGNADPAPSFRISHSRSRVYFCEANKEMSFNLDTVLAAINLIGDLPWRKTVAPAIHRFEDLKAARRRGDPDEIKKTTDKLESIFKKTPELRHLLGKLNILPGSGEMQVLYWCLE